MDSIFNQPKPIVTIPDEVKNALVQNAAPYPLPAGKKFQYGTAGVSCQYFGWDQSAELLFTVSHEGVSSLHFAPQHSRNSKSPSRIVSNKDCQQR
jgi:hypothetical protein